MEDKILKLKNDIESYLKDSEEHQDKQIEYIIRNPFDNEIYVLASNQIDEAIECRIINDNANYDFYHVPEWDFNFDYYVFSYLEDGFEVEYMNDNTNYGIWNSIHELYPEDIDYKNGVQSYLQYCVDNEITKDKLDKSTGLDTPNIMKYFEGLAVGDIYDYGGYIAKISDVNHDNANEYVVDIYGSKQDFIDGNVADTAFLKKWYIKTNIKDYINEVFVYENNFKSEKDYFSFILGYDLLNDMLSESSAPEVDISYDFCSMIADKFMQSEEYKNKKYSSYDMLSEWVYKNRESIQCEHIKFTGQELNNGLNIIETGYRGGKPIALLSKKINDSLEYLIAFNYDLNNNHIEWDYGYYYGGYKDLARKDFDKVISGGNLSRKVNERGR